MAEVRLQVEGPVGHIIISNPPRFNAMTKAMWQAFGDGVEALDANRAVRVIVVRGEGTQAFVSGADISQFGEARTAADQQREYDAIVQRAYEAPRQAGKPVIAAIQGYCIGGGLGLAAACDLRICSRTARFRMPAARLGLGYAVAGVRHFVSLIGYQAVIDLFGTARVFDAAEAHRIGFVSQVVEAEQIDALVEGIARTIAANAPLTLSAVKLAARTVDDDDAALAQAAERAVLVCAESQDYREGTAAFIAKRPPVFSGQ